MKKKGLIISTIVMVVVLIASLTTATYAWFNANAQAKVNDIEVSVKTTSRVLIGVKSGSFSEAYGTSAPNFKNGTVTYSGGTAGQLNGNFGGTAGLGTTIDLNKAKLYSIGGVFTAAATTENSDFDGSYDNTGVYTANAVGDHYYCDGSITENTATTSLPQGTAKVKGAATVNSQTGTLVFAPFGVRAAQSGLKYMWCDITFTTSADYWGIVAATRLHITIDGKSYNALPFAGDTDSVTAGNQPITWDTATGVGGETTSKSVTFRVMLDSKTGEATLPTGDSATIYKCEIIAFIDGTSPNCVQEATQYISQMQINFDASDVAPTEGATINPLTLA